MTRWVFIAAFHLLVTGCLYPGNLTKTQWNALSPAEQERLVKQEELEIRQQRQVGAMPRGASNSLPASKPWR